MNRGFDSGLIKEGMKVGAVAHCCPVKSRYHTRKLRRPILIEQKGGVSDLAVTRC